jgi:hypothetical protein
MDNQSSVNLMLCTYVYLLVTRSRKGVIGVDEIVCSFTVIAEVSQVFNNPQGSRVRGRPKQMLEYCVQADISKCQITDWTRGAGWEKSVKETKVRIGL